MIFSDDFSLLLTLFFAMFVFNVFIMNFWNSPAMKQLHGVYNAVQKIHDGNTPRLGGLIFYIILFLIVYTVNFQGADLLQQIVLALIPTVVVTVIEDLFNNIQPKARLYSIFMSSALLLFITNTSNPVINIPIVMEFFQDYPLVLSFLLIVCLTGLANGFNLIDGTNGLLYFTFLSILISMLMIASAIDSQSFININILLICLTSISILFNYPMGKIFAGDLGAYCLGLLVGFTTIALFSENPSLITWYTLLILFYPVFELVFTVLRRLKAGKPMMQADTLHLHQIIHRILSQRFSSQVANNLIVIILMPVWLFPLIWLTLFGPLMSFFMTWLGILIEIVIYLSFYQFIKTVYKNNE